MKTRNELKEQAKTALRGNWPWAVGVLWVPTLVLIVVFGILLGVISLVWKAATADFTASSNVVLIFIVMAFLMLALFTFFASIGISAGATYAYLDLIRGRKQSFREAATYAFKEQRFDSIFGVVLMTVSYILLWMVLLIIPGYMKAMAYSQGLFILKDDMETGKGITTTSAITKSKILMEGHKKDYFILILSFLGWALVPIAFCGLAVALFVSHQIGWAIFCLALYILGLAILVPYVTTTQAAFYEDLIHQEQPEEIAQLEEKLADARDTMDQLELPVYSLNTRREVPGSNGYKIYDTISIIIDSLANVFPIFLYFVAALVTLTTMTRFVDEERINSGTLKALGYTDQDVMKKFTIYGLVSELTGSIAGIVLGHILVPIIIYNAYGASFDVPQIEMHFYLKTTIIALILAMISTILPAWIVASRELREKPATLLLPKPPAKGSKIFLEYIKPIWNKMSFTHKVTARNIFRYKKRMLMTIFGVCGAVTLLFAGFSVQNSISGINEKQFGEIIKYDLIVAQNNNLNDEKQNEMNALLTDEAVKQQSPVYYDSLTKVAGKNQDKQEIKLIVTNDEAKFDDYIALEYRKTQKKIDLKEKEGAVISERFAKLLNVEVGDSFTISDSNSREYKLKVADITEMYTGHYLFMNDSYYEKSFSKEYEPNANLIILKDKSKENARVQASKFMQSDSVKGVVQNMTLTNQIDTIVVSLNKVMQVLIVVAIMLAVVILYNLTNINIAERIRELSTIKVLGFYDKEVTMYIYRETILLSLIGILAGFVFGDILYQYILAVVPPDEVMFNSALGAKAFVVPVMLIVGITVILGYIMNKKLSKLDMLSALKSVD